MDIFVPQIKFLFHLPLFLKLQVKLYRTTTELCSVWFGVHSSKNKPFNNKSHWMVYKIWAGVDSNHRRLASTDLQSVAFSHSATDPYLICLWRDLNSWPLPYQGSALPLRHKGLVSELTSIKKLAGNRNRTYNLRFTKPLLYRWAMPACLLT